MHAIACHMSPPVSPRLSSINRFTQIHTRLESSLSFVTIPPALFMWPFSSPQNPYRETIKAKRTCRADVLELAPPFSAEEHQKYLSATGTVQLPS